MSEEKIPFARKATGLVRGLGLKDVFIMAGGCWPSGIIIWYLTEIPYLYPGIDLVLGFSVAAILTIIGMAIPYAMMSIAMPRAAADYTGTSRILHPAIGFAANWMWVWACPWTAGPMVFLVGSFFLSQWFGTLGHMLNNPGLIALAEAVVSTEWCLVIGVTLVILFGIIMLSHKSFSYTQTTLFIFTMLGIIAFGAVLAVSSPAVFAGAFNKVSSVPRDQVIPAAQALGMELPKFAPLLILSSLPYTLWWIVTPSWMMAPVGEVKRPERNLVIAAIGGVIFTLFFVVILAPLFYRVIGHDFTYALVWLAYEHPESYPLPFYCTVSYLSSLLFANPLIVSLIFFGFVCGWLIYFPGWYMIMTRSTFAWAFDRIFPEKLSEVSEKFHTPVYSILLWTIMNLICVFLAAYTPVFQWFFNITLVCVSSYIPVVIACALLPYRRKDVFEAAPRWIRTKIGPIPVITICGTVGAILFIIGVIANFIWVPAPATGWTVWSVVIWWIVGFAIYYIARYYRKKQGIDISMTFKEIPPV